MVWIQIAVGVFVGLCLFALLPSLFHFLQMILEVSRDQTNGMTPEALEAAKKEEASVREHIAIRKRHGVNCICGTISCICGAVRNPDGQPDPNFVLPKSKR